jgi:hypothetical protein
LGGTPLNLSTPAPGSPCTSPHRRHRPGETCGSCPEGAVEV